MPKKLFSFHLQNLDFFSLKNSHMTLCHWKVNLKIVCSHIHLWLCPNVNRFITSLLYIQNLCYAIKEIQLNHTDPTFKMRTKAALYKLPNKLYKLSKLNGVLNFTS